MEADSAEGGGAGAASTFVSDVRAGLLELLESGAHADVALVIGGEGGARVRAHRVVLCMRSPHLRRVLAASTDGPPGGARGAEGSGAAAPAEATIVLEGVSLFVAQQLVRYMYADAMALGDADDDAVVQLAALAEQCECAPAVARAEAELISRLSTANAASLFRAAVESGVMPRVRQRALRLLAHGQQHGRQRPRASALALGGGAGSAAEAEEGGVTDDDADDDDGADVGSAAAVREGACSDAEEGARLAEARASPTAAAAAGVGAVDGLRVGRAARLATLPAELCARVYEEVCPSAPLVPAIADGRVDVARHLLAAHADPNGAPAGGRGCSPLWAALRTAQRPLAQELLERGAAIGARGCPHGDTALHRAALRADVRSGYEAVQWLLAHGAPPNATNHLGQTALDALQAAVGADALAAPLGSAAAARAHRAHRASARALLAAGAHARARDGCGESLWHAAARHDDAKLLDALLAADGAASVDAPDDAGRPPLFVALRHHAARAAVRLLDGGARPAMGGGHGGAGRAVGAVEYALFGQHAHAGAHAGAAAREARREGGEEAAGGVPAAGATAEATDARWRLAAALLRAGLPLPPEAEAGGGGGDGDDGGGGGGAPLGGGPLGGGGGGGVGGQLVHAAARGGSGMPTNLAAFIIRYCAPALHADGTGAADGAHRTPLHVAAAAGNVTALAHLLGAGADVGARDAEGRTALHLAATRAPEGCLLLLLRHGAHVDARDARGRAPLHGAAASECPLRLLTALLEAGADANAADAEGRTALHVLCAHPDGAVWSGALRELLLEHRADVRAADAAGATPAHLAAARGRVRVVQELVRCGAPPHAVDGMGRCVLDVLALPLVSAGGADEPKGGGGGGAPNGGPAGGAAAALSLRRLQRDVLACVRAPPAWLPDEAVRVCQACARPFDLGNRRHHCRHCGRILCAECSAHRSPVPKFGLHAQLRVCAPCAEVLADELRVHGAGAGARAGVVADALVDGDAAGVARSLSPARVAGADAAAATAARDEQLTTPTPPAARRHGAEARVAAISDIERAFD